MKGTKGPDEEANNGEENMPTMTTFRIAFECQKNRDFLQNICSHQIAPFILRDSHIVVHNLKYLYQSVINRFEEVQLYQKMSQRGFLSTLTTIMSRVSFAGIYKFRDEYDVTKEKLVKEHQEQSELNHENFH